MSRAKCLVKDCTNHPGEGTFEGPLCVPCYQFITTTDLRKAQGIIREIKRAKEVQYKEMQHLLEVVG